jgi:hypothetical protein
MHMFSAANYQKSISPPALAVNGMNASLCHGARRQAA